MDTPSHHWQRAGITFIDAFLGSFATLLAGSALLDINVEGEVLPDVRMLAQMLVAAAMAGLIALITYVRSALAGME
jgi:hypothetical protein